MIRSASSALWWRHLQATTGRGEKVEKPWLRSSTVMRKLTHLDSLRQPSNNRSSRQVVTNMNMTFPFADNSPGSQGDFCRPDRDHTPWRSQRPARKEFRSE